MKRMLMTFMVCCCCACFVFQSRGEDAAAGFEATFHRVANMNGQPRGIATRELELRDYGILVKAVPFLEEASKNGNPGARDLAQNLLLKLRRPNEHAAWKKAALVTSDRSVRTREDGAMVVRWAASSERHARELGLSPLPQEVLITHDAGPVIRSFFREGRQESVVDLIPGCLDAAWAPLLMDSIGLIYRVPPISPQELAAKLRLPPGPTRDVREDAMIPLLTRIAKEAEPELRAAISAVIEAPPPDPKDHHAVSRRRGLEYRAAAVTSTFARAGDDSFGEETRRTLLLAIDHFTDRTALGPFSASLGKLNVPGTGERLFLRSAAAVRDPELQRETVPYGVLRKHALEWMKRNGAAWLVEKGAGFGFPESAMRAGWLFELESPDVAEAMYLYWADFYKNPHPIFVDERNPVEDGYHLFWNNGMLPPGFEIPTILLTERATVLPRDVSSSGTSFLSELARREKAPLAFEVIARWFPAHDAIRALGELGDRRAFDVFRTLPDLPIKDRQTFLLVAEAVMKLGGDEAVRYFEEIVAKREVEPGGNPNHGEHVQWRHAAGLAERLIPAVRGDENALLALVEGDEAVLRPIAAELLARRSHPKGIEKLIEFAIQARGSEHQRYRDLLDTQKEMAAENLEARFLANKDWRERLFAEAVLLRIREPETVLAFHRGISASSRPWTRAMPPSLDFYFANAKLMVEKAGKEAHPLIEAAAAFQTDYGNALLALAAIGTDRALDLLIHMLPDLPPERRPQAVFALQQFGHRGIEAAKTVPPAIPGMAGFGSRRGAHLAATGARVAAGDVTSLESVLAGLAALPPADAKDFQGKDLSQWYQWIERSQAYLRHARAFRDPRLLEIGISLIQKEHPMLAESALPLVGDYDDPRVVPLCWDMLSKKRAENKLFYQDEKALDVLVAKLGDDLIPRLAERFSAEPSSELRTKWLHIMARLDELSRWKKLPNLRRKAVLGLRTPLIRAIDDPLPDIEFLAAELLAKFSMRNWNEVGNIDRMATGPLLAWSRRQQRVPNDVVRYLEHDGHPDAGELMMRLYLISNPRNSVIATALATLRYQTALPEIVKAAEIEMRPGPRFFDGSDLAAINKFGSEGWKHLRRLAENRDFDFSKRVSAASILAGSSAIESRDVVVKLVDEYLQIEKEDPEGRPQDLGMAVQNALGIEDAQRLFTSKLLITDNPARQSWLAYWLERWEREKHKSENP